MFRDITEVKMSLFPSFNAIVSQPSVYAYMTHILTSLNKLIDGAILKQVCVAIPLQSSAIVMMSSACLSSVTRMYCDETAEGILTRFSLEQRSAKCRNCQHGKFDGVIYRAGGPFVCGFKLRWMVFKSLRGTVSRKRRKIEPRSQLITNRKSYTGFRYVQK